MKKETYDRLEGYMLACCADSAHDAEHIYRVLHNALEIAGDGPVDYDVLIAACLLHDIGRKAQLEDPTQCHAQVGSKMAYDFLMAQGFSEDFAARVAHCILTHRFRKHLEPQTEEAKILFDADKLDVTGCLGIARTLMYKGNIAEPIYARLPDGSICDGSSDDWVRKLLEEQSRESPKDLALRLVQGAAMRGAQDDLTALVVRVEQRIRAE